VNLIDLIIKTPLSIKLALEESSHKNDQAMNLNARVLNGMIYIVIMFIKILNRLMNAKRINHLIGVDNKAFNNYYTIKQVERFQGRCLQISNIRI